MDSFILKGYMTWSYLFPLGKPYRDFDPIITSQRNHPSS